MSGHDHLARLKILNTVLKTIENCEDEATALAMIQRNRDVLSRVLTEQRCGHVRPFIIKTCQLDTTQPEDYGYGTPEWKQLWLQTPGGIRLLKKEMPHRLSVTRNLNNHVLGRSVLHNHKGIGAGIYGLVPEISNKGMRRCCFVKKNGMRCMRHADGCVCKFHARLVESIPRMNDMFVSSIKSEPLRQAFEKHLNNPDYKNVRGEVALMRTMLDAILHRMDATTDLSQIPFAELAAVTQMCQHITATVEKMATIEAKMNLRLSMDQVSMLILNVVNLVVSTLSPSSEKMIVLAEGIENLPLMRTISADSMTATKDYGMDLADGQGAKMTTALAKFTEDGAVDPAGITKEEYEQHQAEVQEHFRTRGEKYRLSQESLAPEETGEEKIKE